GGGLGSKQVSLLTRQLATLISASAPVEEALQTVALQADNEKIRTILLSVRSNVMEGSKLSTALSQHPGAFSPLYVALINAGETAGSLGPVMDRLADYLEKSQKMRSRIINALVYPGFLAATAIAVVTLLMVFVVPRVVEQFESMGQDLPGLTVALIGLSDFIRSYGLVLLLLVVAGLALFTRQLRRPGFRWAFDAFVLKIPVLGRLLKELQAARLARTLSALISSGTPVLESLGAARSTIGNRVLNDAVSRAMIMVSEGTSLSAALRRTQAVPPMVIYMAATGEKSGQLDVMLAEAADYLETEFDDFTNTAIGLLEPAIIILMGGVVALIVLAILLPMLQFNSMALI
ncbi:MAG: type II secretion system inner membrane protein GspF, partial [Alphaproteobacteria bacterium]|nr:type II secretion system inner membrane protein GspF [Alphaproteobacteria bacterium]